jgi:hypothetical protein
MARSPEQTLELLDRLVGTWRTVATHPLVPGVIIQGIAHVSWLEGFKFLIHRANCDHPDFPDSLSVIGFTEHDRAGGHGDADEAEAPLTQHYYDSRGVFRAFTASIDEKAWRFSRIAPGFSQRFTGTFEDDYNTIVGVSELCTDDVTWNRDLAITYQRERKPLGE